MKPDRVIIGTDSKKANKIMKSLYLPIIKKNSRYFNTSRRGAELIKYASNAFLATKISFINEIANLCEKTGVDIKDISLGMGSDQRIGARNSAGNGWCAAPVRRQGALLRRPVHADHTNAEMLPATFFADLSLRTCNSSMSWRDPGT